MVCKMVCKNKTTEMSKDDPSDPAKDIIKTYHTCAIRELVSCEGKPEDKAECPFWSGGLGKQTYIKRC